MAPDVEPAPEPLRATLLRNGAIAVVAGGIVALSSGTLGRWPLGTLVALWFSLGGHVVELCFLNGLRPRLPVARSVQVGARLVVWWLGGIGLGLGMGLTAHLLGGLSWARWPAWYVGGIAFVVVELVVHLGLALRARPNFYDGRG